MLKWMTRAIYVAAGALVALAGIALLFFGGAWLAPHFFADRSGRTPIIAVLVLCLVALQVTRWRKARKRAGGSKGDDVPAHPLGLDS